VNCLKNFEENKRGSLQEVHDYFSHKGVKGEIVIVIGGTE
jgi:16S rRNA (cytidine1402-2'-O)-methyltransferase